MKAISIRQPWAHLILYAGKDIENRDWPTRYRGPILIHAAKTMTKADRRATELAIDADDRLYEAVYGSHACEIMMRQGGIVGRARIVDCVTESDSPWFFGKYGFVLADVEPLPFYPCRGALGLFEVEMPEAVRKIKGGGA